MATKRNIIFDGEDDFSYELNVKDDLGVAVDLTGYTFYMTAVDASEVVLFAKVITTIPDAVNGNVTITLDKEDTEDKVAGSYPYDIKWTDNLGKDRTLLEGNFILTKTITKIA